MKLWFSKKVITVLADAIESRKETLVVNTLALNINEWAFTEWMTHEYAGIRDADTRGHQ